MTLTNQAHAADVNISSLLTSPDNPAQKLSGINTIGELLKGKDGGLDIINFVFIIIGLVFFANLIMVGWEFMFSSGDPKKVQASTTRLMNGFFGLIIAFAAFIVVRLITNILGLGNLV